ncbi:Protein strawberry notch-like protein 1 [Bienertia sinuspersici]
MESRVQRLKFAWRIFMIANFGLGAYIFAMAKMKEGSSKSEKQVEAPLVVPAVTSAPKVDRSEEPEIVAATPIAELMKVHEPISEDEQRDLFKWILNEKRKAKPRNRDEKRRIDEEKSILKQFIRADSIPSL